MMKECGSLQLEEQIELLTQIRDAISGGVGPVLTDGKGTTYNPITPAVDIGGGDPVDYLSVITLDDSTGQFRITSTRMFAEFDNNDIFFDLDDGTQDASFSMNEGIIVIDTEHFSNGYYSNLNINAAPSQARIISTAADDISVPSRSSDSIQTIRHDGITTVINNYAANAVFTKTENSTSWDLLLNDPTGSGVADVEFSSSEFNLALDDGPNTSQWNTSSNYWFHELVTSILGNQIYDDKYAESGQTPYRASIVRDRLNDISVSYNMIAGTAASEGFTVLYSELPTTSYISLLTLDTNQGSIETGDRPSGVYSGVYTEPDQVYLFGQGASQDFRLLLDSTIEELTFDIDLGSGFVNYMTIDDTGVTFAGGISNPLDVYRDVNTVGLGVAINFDLENSTNSRHTYAEIQANIVTNTSNLEDGELEINLLDGGTNDTVFLFGTENHETDRNIIVSEGTNAGVFLDSDIGIVHPSGNTSSGYLDTGIANGWVLGNTPLIITPSAAPIPEGSAALKVQSTTQGFLPPVMTTAQRTAIAIPAAGLMVYDSDLEKLCLYNDTEWRQLDDSVIP